MLSCRDSFPRDADRTDRRSAIYARARDRKSTRLNSSHLGISYAVFCLKKKKKAQPKNAKRQARPRPRGTLQDAKHSEPRAPRHTRPHYPEHRDTSHTDTATRRSTDAQE